MPRAVQVKHAVALGDNILEMSDNVALQLELIRTLGAFDVPEATAGLRLASESDIPEVRIAACRAWALQSSPERVGILLERVVGETDKDVRIAAMRSLGGCQSVEDQTRIRESLQDVLDDEDPAVQYAATESLEASSGLDLNGNIRLWKRFLAGELNEKQAMENAASVRDSYFQQLIKSGITIGDVMPWNWF